MRFIRFDNPPIKKLINRVVFQLIAISTWTNISDYDRDVQSLVVAASGADPGSPEQMEVLPFANAE